MPGKGILPFLGSVTHRSAMGDERAILGPR